MNTNEHECRRVLPASLRIKGFPSLCFLVAMLFSSYSIAEPFGTNLTLQAALDYGAENNPQLKSAFQQWQGLEYNISVQKALPDPMLTYGYYFESVETRVGPQNQSFGLSQKFPGFGKRSSMKSIATDRAAAEQQRYRSEKLSLDFSITQAYTELYYLKRSMGITRDRIDLIRNLEEVARQRYASGSSMAPVLQAQVELGRLEDQLNSLRDMQQPREAALNALLNRPADGALPISSSLPYRSVAADAAALGKDLSHTSPELQELAAKVDLGTHKLELARRERLPDFTLGVMYIDTGPAAGAVSDSGKDPVIGTVGINIPLWIGKNRARIESASYLKTAARLNMENRVQTLDAEIRQALFKLRDADRKINLYKESLIPKTVQSLEVNRQGFETGKMEFINLIDAERMLLEFELSHERALADHLIARAELSQLTGINFLTDESISLAEAQSTQR